VVLIDTTDRVDANLPSASITAAKGKFIACTTE